MKVDGFLRRYVTPLVLIIGGPSLFAAYATGTPWTPNWSQFVDFFVGLANAWPLWGVGLAWVFRKPIGGILAVIAELLRTAHAGKVTAGRATVEGRHQELEQTQVSERLEELPPPPEELWGPPI